MSKGIRMAGRDRRGFTLVELLTVITIIAILAGLILAGAGYAQNKAARERAKTEMAGLSAACESYKADNGIYPRDPGNSSVTDALITAPPASANYDPKNYQAASKYLYGQLSGDYDNGNAGAATNYNGKMDGNEGRGYMEFKPGMLAPRDSSGNIAPPITYIQDPFGYSYGYSTAAQSATPTNGNNPTFDLWSTGGTNAKQATGDPQAKWIKNW